VRMSSRGRSCAGCRVSNFGGSTRMGAEVLIVADNSDRTEHELTAAELAFHDCQGELRPWGHARARRLRTRHGTRKIRPRRACCRACGQTHVLLAGVALLRRADAVELIGAAIVANAAGQGHRPIAARLGRPEATVRGWLRRFAARAEQTASHAVAWVYRLDVNAFRVEPRQDDSPVQFALAALGRAVAAAEHFMGTAARSRWQVVSSLCSGRLLANTSCPYPPLR